MNDNRTHPAVTHYMPRGKIRFRCGVKIKDGRWWTIEPTDVTCDGCKAILRKGPKP